MRHRRQQEDLLPQLCLALAFAQDSVSPIEIDEPLTFAAFVLEVLWDGGYQVVRDEREYGG
jgi:hypothetical protein